MTFVTIGIVLANSVSQLHGNYAEDRPRLRRQLRRNQMF